MKRALAVSIAALSACVTLSASAAQTPLDPPRDPAHPARSEVLHIPSAGLQINGLAYIASGQGVHPTLVICHGWPGNEKNLDLAQAVRRAGWNAVTFNYRGSWGSPGEFHFSQVPEDAAAVVAWLRRPEVAAKLGVDTHRIAMAGHSMGGWATARTAALDSRLVGAILIAPADMGALGKMSRANVVKAAADDAETLVTSPEKMADELMAQSDAFALTQSAPGLTKIPVLVLTADDGLAPSAGALVAAIRAHGGTRIQTQHFITDHSFNDSRLALQNTIINWLQALPSPSSGGTLANGAGDTMTDNSRLSVMLDEDQADRYGSALSGRRNRGDRCRSCPIRSQATGGHARTHWRIDQAERRRCDLLRAYGDALLGTLIGDVMSLASGLAGPAFVFWAAMTSHLPERFSATNVIKPYRAG